MSSQDEVWIDTSVLRELREKKRKRHVRPISKLLNPLVRGGGYSTAVALSFTQTKLEMPPTKQSTISSFFRPQQKESEKKSTSSLGRYGDASVRGAPIKSQETKPLKDFGCQTPFNHSALNDSDIFNMAMEYGDKTLHADEYGDNICGEELAPEHEKASKEQMFLHLIRGYESEEEDVEKPEEKRGAYEASFMPGAADKQPHHHQQSSRRPCLLVPDTLALSCLDITNRYSQPLRPSHQRNTASPDSISGFSELSEGEFRARMQHAGRTSTQTKGASSSSMHSPTKHAGKENCAAGTERLRDSGYSGSPVKGSRSLTPSSPAAKTRPWENKSQSPLKPFFEAVPPSPRKLDLDVDWRAAKPPRPWETTGKSQSPLRPFLEDAPLPSRKLDMEADSMAALFTQDSQGFRVIAHRPLQQQQWQSWSALKDRTNIGGSRGGGGEGGWRVPSADAPEDKDEEESQLEAEMLFTQDSQGNLVIKH